MVVRQLSRDEVEADRGYIEYIVVVTARAGEAAHENAQRHRTTFLSR
jgi:hypothetical protein